MARQFHRQAAPSPFQGGGKGKEREILMDASRLFTQSELNDLCLPGEARFLAALERGGQAHAKAVYEDVEKAFREFHDIYIKWVATVLEFLYERHGHEAMAKALALEGMLAGAF